jgi:aryl sulfotransferase
MTGRTVWLTSYPKSGNTWVRAIITALATPAPLFGVDHLIAGSQPHVVAAALPALGLDPRWLSEAELDAVRDALIRRVGASDDPAAEPIVRKTHERFRPGVPGREPFPPAATRAAVLVVRDPRDVVASYAAFFGMTVDEAITAMNREGGSRHASALHMRTAQPWGTWSTHARSWLDDQVPFPVHVVRYEDLTTDAVTALLPVLTAIGLPTTRDALAAAVEQARFDHLQESEDARGFREVHRNTTRFFRRGEAGSWHDELTAAQARRVEAEHGEVMDLLGYESSSPAPAPPPAIALPAHLGLRARRGRVPSALPGARQPRPWADVADGATLLRLRDGAGVLVTGGRDIVAQPPAGGSPEWIVQGWGVTLAMLQRGLLSLHAAVLDVNGTAIAVAGDRGAGKSTTAVALAQRGHEVLCDDVAVLEFRPDGVWTMPYWRAVHLLEDAAERLGVDFDALPALGPERAKAAWPAADPGADQRPLGRVVVLVADPAVDEVRVEEARGSARMAALAEHARRDGIAPVILGEEQYFAQVARLADSLPVTVIRRPAGSDSLAEVVAAIEALA